YPYASLSRFYIIPFSRKGEGISYYSMSITIATAIGPFIGIFMSQHTTYKMIFTFCALLAIISLIIALLVRIPATETPETSINEKQSFKISNYIEPKDQQIAVIIIILSYGYSI